MIMKFNIQVTHSGEMLFCPLKGDESNDCADCIYSGDYHFDKETGECERR